MATLTKKEQGNLAHLAQDPQIAELLRKIIAATPASPTPRRRGPEPRDLADRFAAGLNEKRVGAGTAKTYDMMMSAVGGQIDRHLKEHGFSPQLFAALIKVYFSREGREVRR